MQQAAPYVKERKHIKNKVIFQHRVDNIKLPAHRETDRPCSMELHVIRLDDVAMCVNPFELYLDYGLRIKGRSKAVLTLVMQLACGSRGYLPTARAIAGGGYSAARFRVGPKGGQVLVEESVRRINAMWE